MSVPRPAMLVATVIFPCCPASATIVGFLAGLRRVQHAMRQVPCASAAGSLPPLASTLRVPTSTGTPLSWSSQMRSTTASHFSFIVSNMRTRQLLADARAVGGDADDGPLVDLPEFGRRFPRRAGHAAP